MRGSLLMAPGATLRASLASYPEVTPAMSDRSMTLRTLLGDYLVTHALRSGEIRSAPTAFDFADVKVPSTAVKRVVRDLEFDVAERALVADLIAKAHHKPLVLVRVVVLGRFQHP